MALEVIAMEGPEARVSDHVARLIATCSRGWEHFFADHDDHQAPRFVPSVPERVWAVLEEVTRRQLPAFSANNPPAHDRETGRKSSPGAGLRVGEGVKSAR